MKKYIKDFFWLFGIYTSCLALTIPLAMIVKWQLIGIGEFLQPFVFRIWILLLIASAIGAWVINRRD